MNGSSWSALGSGVSRANGAAIYSLVIYNGNLIAIGLFDSVGNISAHSIAQWNGTTWSALGRGLGSDGQGVCSIVYNNELLVGGELDSAGSISNSDDISVWNGSVWDTINNSRYRQGSIVGAFALYNGNLIIRGYSNIQEWGGGNKWTIINDSLLTWGLPNSGNSMGVYNGNLIVTAYNKVDEWNGSSWATIGTFNVPQQLSINYGGMAVQAVTIYNGKLAVCGVFTPNGVALYDGSSWTSL